MKPQVQRLNKTDMSYTISDDTLVKQALAGNQGAFEVLMALVIGNMIGSGIFLLPSSLASFGSISLVSWLLTSVGAVFLALLFGRFPARFAWWLAPDP